jgi:hypothetical protein
MIVLQSLGLKAGLPTPFYYRRDNKGVLVQFIRGKDKGPVAIDQGTWQELLETLARSAKSRTKTFSVSSTISSLAPNQSLYDFIRDCLKKGQSNLVVTDSLLSAICAILVHEGSLQLYHGRIGKDREARVVLRISA